MSSYDQYPTLPLESLGSGNGEIKATLDPTTFAAVLGQAVWLMTLSKQHRDRPLHLVEELIVPAIYLKQYRLYTQGKQPVAILVWAGLSDAVERRFEQGDKTLSLSDWRSGSNIRIIDCISPFNPQEVFESSFRASLQETSRE